ncbi:MAG: hypothetical protein HY321_16885 [Armatimonadetes bacterium]|nr:hypothetical protein [Armatimonadota bacterium]
MEQQDEERGPERIERLPGEMESAMYSGSDEGEPAPGQEEIGPLPTRAETLEVFDRVEQIIEERQEERTAE